MGPAVETVVWIVTVVPSPAVQTTLSLQATNAEAHLACGQLVAQQNSSASPHVQQQEEFLIQREYDAALLHGTTILYSFMSEAA